MAFRFDGLLGMVVMAMALLVAPLAGAAEEQGVWWDVTSDAMGMSTKQRLCLPEGGPTEMPPPDPGCTYSEVRTVGKRTTFRVTCTGQDAMSGSGDITRGDGTFAGILNMQGTMKDRKGNSQQMAVAMTMKGQRAGGACDPNAAKKKVAAIKQQQQELQNEMQAQAQKANAQMCDRAATDLNFRLFAKQGGPCASVPAALAKLREILGTFSGYTGYLRAAEGDPTARQVYEEVMNSDPEADKAKLCKKAAASSSCEKTPDEVTRFLRKNCPTEMRGIARLCCPGRDFSGVNALWYDICTDYAKEVLGKGGLKDQPKPAKTSGDTTRPAEKTDSPHDQAVQKARDALKGLFGN
ncbi:MAG TPA: DUF3617 family protein [Anaeromyxobacter sp.]|nr:DUF3617 family protein [Anaeromyxobacter sp.]